MRCSVHHTLLCTVQRAAPSLCNGLSLSLYGTAGWSLLPPHRQSTTFWVSALTGHGPPHPFATTSHTAPQIRIAHTRVQHPTSHLDISAVEHNILVLYLDLLAYVGDRDVGRGESSLNGPPVEREDLFWNRFIHRYIKATGLWPRSNTPSIQRQCRALGSTVTVKCAAQRPNRAMYSALHTAPYWWCIALISPAHNPPLPVTSI